VSLARAQAAVPAPPRVWLVLGDKLGDNRQVEVVVEALPWPCEVRRLAFRPRWREGKPPFIPSLFHVDRGASDPLEPPWPDLILTIGRRPAMAALWIRRRSGGRTRVVLFGRPKRYFGHFSLVIAPPQYGLPERSNVLRLALPLMRVDEAALAAAEARWREPLAGLPRPLTVVLVGGRTKPFRMDAAVARDLIARVRAAVGDTGTVYVTTSRRTPAPVVAALREVLPPGAQMHAWRPEGAANPYLGLLAHGDRFVVTGDSVSMMTEIARLGRPLWIYPLPERSPGPARRALRAAARGVGRVRLHAAARALGLLGWPRDLSWMHRALYARGLAAPLGASLPEVVPDVAEADAGDERRRVAASIEALMAAAPGGEKRAAGG